MVMQTCQLSQFCREYHDFSTILTISRLFFQIRTNLTTFNVQCLIQAVDRTLPSTFFFKEILVSSKNFKNRYGIGGSPVQSALL